MDSNFYISRNDEADSWQLSSRVGSPCMARGTLAAAIATAERLATVRANRMTWPIPVFHASNDDTPAVWNGVIDRDGNWTGRR
jgi:hypothetical protein